jgi:hypothetical protein
MTQLTFLFAVSTILVGVVTSFGIWAPRLLWSKVAVLLVTLGALPITYLSLAELLGQPKPIDLEWWHRKAAEATVVGSIMREGEGIDLWLQLPDMSQPRAYTLPWSQPLAEQLQAAKRTLEGTEGQLRMKFPFEPSLDNLEPKFYAMPQPAPPPKGASPNDARPGQDT